MALLNRQLSIAALLCFFPALLFSSEANWWGVAKGGASFKHLALATETRSAALSGAGVAWSGRGIASMQPAMQAAEPLRLAFHRTWLPEEVGAKLDRFEVMSGSGKNGFSFAGEMIGYDEIEGYDDDGNRVGDYGAGAWQLNATFSRNLGVWRWGARIAGGQFEIEEADSWAMMGDFGITRDLPLGFRLGTALRHLGWATAFVKDEPSLPTELAVGLVQEGSWRNRWISWSLGVDLRRRNGDGLAAVTALELLWNDRIAVRVGYPFGEDHPGLSGGFGLRSRWIDADYAVISDGLYSLRHQLGLSLLL